MLRRQLLGEIVGGKVIKSKSPEIGMLDINFSSYKKKDIIFGTHHILPQMVKHIDLNDNIPYKNYIVKVDDFSILYAKYFTKMHTSLFELELLLSTLVIVESSRSNRDLTVSSGKISVIAVTLPLIHAKI